MISLRVTTHSEDHQKATYSRLKRLLTKTNGIEGITPDSVTEFQDEFTINPDTGLHERTVTRNHVRRTLTRFFKYLRFIRYVPKDWDPLENIKKVEEIPSKEGIIVLSDIL